MRWFDRPFAFPFPVDIWPSVIERLRGLLPRVADKLDGADLADMTRVPVSGGWSAQTQLGHLLDLEALWQARIEDYFSEAERLTAADLENRKTHDTDHDARDLGQIVFELNEAREATLARVAELAPEDFAREKLHPRLDQPLRLVDHFYFVAEHDDHHLACITALLAGPK